MEPTEWGFIPLNSRNEFVACVLCGAHGLGASTHDREGNPHRSAAEWLLAAATFASPWQRRHWAPHPYLCACGLAFPTTQSLGAHVSVNRRWRNPGHGSMERVGY